MSVYWCWVCYVFYLQAFQKLDALVELRGELVHRGNIPSLVQAQVNRDQLLDMVALVEQLAWGIEVTWGTSMVQVVQ